MIHIHLNNTQVYVKPYCCISSDNTISLTWKWIYSLQCSVGNQLSTTEYTCHHAQARISTNMRQMASGLPTESCCLLHVRSLSQVLWNTHQGIDHQRTINCNVDHHYLMLTLRTSDCYQYLFTSNWILRSIYCPSNCDFHIYVLLLYMRSRAKFLYHDNFANEFNNQKPEILVQYRNALTNWRAFHIHSTHSLHHTYPDILCASTHHIVTGALDPVTSHISRLWINILIV